LLIVTVNKPKNNGVNVFANTSSGSGWHHIVEFTRHWFERHRGEWRPEHKIFSLILGRRYEVFSTDRIKLRFTVRKPARMTRSDILAFFGFLKFRRPVSFKLLLWSKKSSRTRDAKNVQTCIFQLMKFFSRKTSAKFRFF
jgi:hypothetical protein